MQYRHLNKTTLNLRCSKYQKDHGNCKATAILKILFIFDKNIEGFYDKRNFKYIINEKTYNNVHTCPGIMTPELEN